MVDALLLPSDLWTICRKHKQAHGTYPHLLRPKSFSEYIQHAKIFRRNPVATQVSDKIAVREFARNRIGDEYLPKIYWKGKDLSQVDLKTLPSSFVVKANNGSTTNILVHDKSQVNWTEIVQRAHCWLEQDYSMRFGGELAPISTGQSGMNMEA